MSVLDPFEVAEIEMCPFWDMPDDGKAAAEMLDRAEFAVYREAVAESEFGTVVNEKPVKEAEMIDMSESTRVPILIEGGERDALLRALDVAILAAPRAEEVA